MASSIMKSLGGLWFFLIGAPLAAWWLLTFFIAPFLGAGGYTINIATVLSLSSPVPILVFILLWFGISLAWFGGSAVYQRNRTK